MANNIVKTHFKSIEKLLLAQSNVARSAPTPSDLGANREFFIRNVLFGHLPEYAKIGTGMICDSNGRISGQTDIVIYHSVALKMQIGSSHAYLAESVFSAIEVKSTLDHSHLRKAVKNLGTIRQMSRSGLFTPLLGKTPKFESYHFNTIGTYIVAFHSAMLPETCAEKIGALCNPSVVGKVPEKISWQYRPEAIYFVDRDKILIRDDYPGESIIKEPSVKSTGYILLDKDALLRLMIMISWRIGTNWSLLPTYSNYL